MFDDAGTIARAKSGDPNAFEAIVRKYQRRVYATALHIMGNHSDADDVAQDAFVRAYRGMAGFDGRADLFTWLYRITVNTALNHLRSKKRVSNLAQKGSDEVERDGGRPERLGEAARTPAQWAELSDHLRRVLTEVCDLSPPLRVTLVLATVEQLPYKTIAQLLDVPEGTVAWRVNEARKQLRERLGPEADAEEQAK